MQSKAGVLLRLSPGQVHDVMARAVARGLCLRNIEDLLPHLSLGEKSFQNGYNYITVLGDPMGRRVIEVASGRTLEAARNLLLSALNPSQRCPVGLDGHVACIHVGA